MDPISQSFSDPSTCTLDYVITVQVASLRNEVARLKDELAERKQVEEAGKVKETDEKTEEVRSLEQRQGQGGGGENLELRSHYRLNLDEYFLASCVAVGSKLKISNFLFWTREIILI